MRKVQKVTMTMFDSMNAHFRVSVEAQFQKKNMAGDLISNTYISNSGTGILNPSIYLVFTYKSDSKNYLDDRTVYMSYPNLKKLRETMQTVDSYAKKGFVDVNGVLSIAPEYSEPILMYDIGKNKKWISFKLAVSDSVENGVSERFPSVQIQLSDSEGFVSVLTLDEFDSVYTIVHDLNLPTIQTELSILFLSGDDDRTPQRGSRPYYESNQQTPRYASRGYQQPGPAGAGMRNPYGQYQQTEYSQQQPQSTPKPTQPTNLPPRSAQSNQIVNMTNLAEVPVDNINFDDTEAIDGFFSNNEDEE